MPCEIASPTEKPWGPWQPPTFRFLPLVSGMAMLVVVLGFRGSPQIARIRQNLLDRGPQAGRYEKYKRPGGRAHQLVIPFQDRGHGMATERRTMTFFCERKRNSGRFDFFGCRVALFRSCHNSFQPGPKARFLERYACSVRGQDNGSTGALPLLPAVRNRSAACSRAPCQRRASSRLPSSR